MYRLYSIFHEQLIELNTMKMKQLPTIEYKLELTDAIKRKVIAFANTQGGELYIGVELYINLENADKVLESVSSMLHDLIQLDILVRPFLESIIKRL